MSQTIALKCPDGTRLHANLYPADTPKGCLVIGSALGVPQGFYRRFAEFIAAHGYHCLTFDYRGTGQSIDRPLQEIALQDWGTQDIDTAISTARQLAAGRDELPVHFMGHSIGGQLLGLAENAQSLTSIQLVAASQPHWSRLRFPHNVKLMTLSHLLLPLVARGKVEFPSSKVGLASMNLPASVATTWAHWMRHREYLFAPTFGLDTKGYIKLTQPLLAWSITDDHMAPYRPVQTLLDQYPATQSEHRSVDVQTLKLGAIGHMGFFRKNAQVDLWQAALTELQKHTPSGATDSHPT